MYFDGRRVGVFAMLRGRTGSNPVYRPFLRNIHYIRAQSASVSIVSPWSFKVSKHRVNATVVRLVFGAGQIMPKRIDEWIHQALKDVDGRDGVAC